MAFRSGAPDISELKITGTRAWKIPGVYSTDVSLGEKEMMRKRRATKEEVKDEVTVEK